MTQLIQSGTGVSPKRIDMTYNPVGQLATIQRYGDLAGTQIAASSTYTYDPLNRLTQLAHTRNTTQINNYVYVYDAASRITQMTSVDGTSTYTYDNTDQLTTASQSFQSNETYTYDLNGNRTNTGYQTTPNNRLQSDGTFTYLYDDEGNLIKRTTIATNDTTEYTWDYRNRLTQVLFKNATGTMTKQVNFIYDALNRRIEKKVDPDGSGPNPATTERFVYDRDHIKLLFNGNNALQRRYQHGPVIDHVVADENSSSGQVSWALSDHQGTVRDWVTSTGTVQKHIRYNSFGRITNQSGTFNNRFWYTGREWDSEIGLYYYRARYYDPLVGRFIGEDPIRFGARDANLYRYVGNHSTWYTDPYGLQRGMHEDEYKELEDICTFGKCGDILGAIDRLKDSIYFREGDIQCGLMAGGKKAASAQNHRERIDKETALLNKCTMRANTEVCPEKLRPMNQPKPGGKPPKPPCDGQPQANPQPVPSLKPKPQRPTPSIGFPEFPTIDIPWLWPLIRKIFEREPT